MIITAAVVEAAVNNAGCVINSLYRRAKMIDILVGGPGARQGEWRLILRKLACLFKINPRKNKST